MRYPPIAIVVSTFNGQKYIEEQILSLLQQDYPNISIIVRDDGSADKTVDLLSKIQKANPNIRLIFGKNIGVIASFNELLSLATVQHDYIFLCDQDDFWHPEKVSISWSHMLDAEKTHGRNAPILIHSDLEVVNESLKIISSSFWRFQKLNGHNAARLNRLLLQNVVTGATIMVNKALVEKSLPFPPEAIMHDWWLALNACLFGKVVTIERPLVSYRQHGANTIGAHGAGMTGLFVKLADLDSVRSRLAATIAQAETLRKMNASVLSPEDLNTIDSYGSLLKGHRLKRLALWLNNRFFKTGLMRNCGLLLILLIGVEIGKATRQNSN
ncbi:glycosyltransferase family 2 protein [Pelovirga terrestris]|uniref:Glycosyltransferase family 2 protein n=1 Tax=Pelovirga terrestris TaxID=2771352 RepID=A0A8J6URG6_9BACT|nr:glycosyltransferase family 2 protein [Pelovirga terrestris]MBD1401311.1 glycosyltransferase family 2 protein [Pelovirga terrestris]